MEIRVRVPAALREVAGGQPVLTCHLADGATVGDLLDVVAASHPALERRIRDEQGTLRAHVNLFVGNEDVRSLSGSGTVLGTDDQVSVLAAISGG